MRVRYTRAAVGFALCALVASPVFAQREDPQTPGAGTPSPAAVSTCAQSSEGVTRIVDALSGRIDEARQTNDAAKMRAAVADLQVALAQMKTQLADCTALTQTAGGAMGTMTGMDHSKPPMASATPVTQPGAPPPASAAPAGGVAMDHSKMQPPAKATASGSAAAGEGAKAAAPVAGMDHSKMAAAPAPKTGAAEPSTVAGMDHSKMGGDKAVQSPSVMFALRTQPARPRSGKNDFEVTVKDGDGKPIADLDVSLAFYMPPTSSMNMPGMRETVALTPAGNGVYTGSGAIGMAGDWDVTIIATRMGQPIGTNKMRLTAK